MPDPAPPGRPAPRGHSVYAALAEISTGQAAADLAEQMSATAGSEDRRRRQEMTTAHDRLLEAVEIAARSASAAARAASEAAGLSTRPGAAADVAPPTDTPTRTTRQPGAAEPRPARGAAQAAETSRLADLASKAATATAIAAGLAQLAAQDQAPNAPRRTHP